MALCQGANRSNILFMRVLLSPIYGKKFIYNDKSNRTKVDALDPLDGFMTELLKKKSKKWQSLKIPKKFRQEEFLKIFSFTEKQSLDDVRNYTTAEIDNLFTRLFENFHYKKSTQYMEQCLEYKVYPSFNILETIVSLYARLGDEKMLLRLKEFIEEKYPDRVKHCGDLLHYFAEALWVQGNIDKSLELFTEVYKTEIYLRRKIRLIMKHLVNNVTSERSEAVVVKIIKHAEILANEYNDFFLMTHIWQVCFISEWYADHCKADKLLDSYRCLLHFLTNKLNFIIHIALRTNKPEILHRLLELLLKYELKSEYARVLQSLFNYRYAQNDIDSCCEILEWSLTLDVPLLCGQHKQFIDLLKKSPKKPKSAPHFELKF